MTRTCIVRAREGNPFKVAGSIKPISLREIVSLINNPSTQKEGLQKLGIKIEERHVLVEFRESGHCYSEPKGDRTKVDGTESEEQFTIKLPLLTPLTQSLDIQVNLTPFMEENINFLGYIDCANPHGERRRILLSGRGTAALEGRPNDAHAGFCTGGACASFQNRCALILAVAAAAGVPDASFDLLGMRLGHINSKFHGRDDILEYSSLCAQKPEVGSYLNFMRKRYSGKPIVPPMLKSYLDTGKPDPAYFEKMKQKMTAEELNEDMGMSDENLEMDEQEFKKKKHRFPLCCFCC